MKIEIPLANNFLDSLEITAAASAIYARIQKKEKKRWFWNNNFNNFK